MATRKQVCNTPFDLSMVDFKCSESQLAETQKLYQSQCNHLSNSDEKKQKGLWTVLTFERLNRIPLFPLIIDSFMRDRLDHYYKTKQVLTSNEWVKEYNTISNLSKHINPTNIKEINNDTTDLLKGCVDIFGKRYSTILNINDIEEKYDDSLEIFASWIIETTSFIKSLIRKDKSLVNKDHSAPPFQIELMIIPRKVARVENHETKGNEDENESDDESGYSDDDDDDPEDEEIQPAAKQTTMDPFEAIPKLEETLTKCNIEHVKETLKGQRQDDPEGVLYKMNPLSPRTRSRFEEKANITHRQRMCIVVDRRSEDTQVFLYQPDLYNKIPRDHVNEWFFESSAQCLIPGKNNNAITSKMSQSGYVFNLSFHIQGEDIIKCYLYTRSSVIRFFPEDIYGLLPELFVDDDKNREFKERESEQKENGMSNKIWLKDMIYENFRKQTSDEYLNKKCK